jgi:polyhydroxybutyrate depolymerase
MKVAALVMLAACGSSPAAPRPVTFGGDRPVDLQVPIGFDDSKTYPIVMVLHGYSANGVIQEAFFGIKNEVDAGNAFVLAPDGLVDSMDHEYWNADAACCDYDHTNVDDVAYLGGLLDDITAAWPIDPAHVIVIGHSNGGWMSYRLACKRSDIITTIGVLAGAATSDPCTPDQPVDVLHIHGTADPEVNYNGAVNPDNGVAYPGAVASTMRWAGFDTCNTTSTPGATVDLDQSVDGAETQISTYGCTDHAVELWTMNGSNHIPSMNATFEPMLWTWLSTHSRM